MKNVFLHQSMFHYTPETSTRYEIENHSVPVSATQNKNDKMYVYYWGGDGCHLRVVPPGQLLRRPSTPKRFFAFHRARLFYSFDVKFFVFAFWWFRVFHWGCYVYFRIVFSSNSLYILYIFIFIYFIYFFIVLIVDLLIIPLRFFFCVCSGFSLASWCWTGCPKETIAI